MADLSQAPVTTTIEEQPKISVQEFSKKVKEKYPDYADVDDVVLAQKMVEKYPEYKERVQFDKTLPETTIPKQQEQVRPQQPLTFMQKQLRERFPENYKDEVKPEAAALIQPPKELSTIDKLKVDYINRTRGEEFAAKKQKELQSTEPSFTNKLGKVTGNEFMLGTNQLNSWIADAPGFIYDLAGAPFRAAGLNVPTSKDFKNTPLTDVSTYYKDQSKLYEDKVKEINPERDKGITDSFKNGDIETGFLNLAGSISESMPASLAMILSGGETLPMILGGGAIFGAGKAQEIDENAPEMNYDKGRLVAAINGTLEGVFETYLGSGAVAKSLSNIIKKEGTEVAKDQVKKSLRTVFTDMLTKSPWLAPLGEGFEEVGTQLAQNAVDKYSGYKPDLDLMSGVGDSFLAGAGMGGIHGATIGLAKAAMKESGINPEKIQQPKPTITTATVEGQQYTVNNPEELGKGGSAIFITAEDGTVKAVNNLKLNDVVTQTPEEIELASQQAVEQQALMQGIDPNAQVIGDETNDFGNGQVRIVEFNNGQSKIFTPDGQEHIINNEKEASAVLDKLFSGEQVVDQTQPEVAEAPKSSRKVISQKFGGTTIDIAEDEGFDEVIPNEKVTLDKALPALEKKFKGNENFELQVEKEEIEEPGETKYDKPIKKVVVKSIRIVPKVSQKENISQTQPENVAETEIQPTEKQTIDNIQQPENLQINQLQNEDSEKSLPEVITNIDLNNIDTDNFIYVTHQTDQRGAENILKNGFDIRGGLNGTTLFGNRESIQRQIQAINEGKGHRGSDRMLVFAFPKTEFQNVRQLDQISDQLIDNGQLTIPSQYIFDVHEKPLESNTASNTESGITANQGENTPQAQQGQGVSEGLEENVNQNIQSVPPVVVESFTPGDSAPKENIPDRTSEAKQVQDVAGQDSDQRPAVSQRKNRIRKTNAGWSLDEKITEDDLKEYPNLPILKDENGNIWSPIMTSKSKKELSDYLDKKQSVVKENSIIINAGNYAIGLEKDNNGQWQNSDVGNSEYSLWRLPDSNTVYVYPNTGEIFYQVDENGNISELSEKEFRLIDEEIAKLNEIQTSKKNLTTEPQKVSFTYLDGSDHTGEVIGIAQDGKLRIKAEDGLIYRMPKDKVNDVRFKVLEREKFFIQETIDELQSAAPNSAPVVIIRSMDDVPTKVKEDPQFNDSVEAFWYNGSIYIFPEMVKSRDHLIEIWIHENGLHHGIRNIIPARDMRLFMNKVYDSFFEIAKNNHEFEDIFKRVEHDYRNSSKQARAEEFLAYLSEKVVSEKDLSPMEQSMWSKYLDMFRNFLGRLFNFNSNLLTERQIIDITRFAVQSNFQTNEYANNSTGGNTSLRPTESNNASASERRAGNESDNQDQVRTEQRGLTISDKAKEDLKTRHNALDAITRIGSELNIPIQVVNSSEVQSDNNQLAFTDNGTVSIVSDRVKSVSDVIKSLVKEVASTKGLREMFAQADPNSIIGKQLAKFDELADNEMNSDKMAQIIRKAFRLTSNQFTNDDLREIVSRSRKQEARFRAEDQSQIVQDARKYNSFEDFVDAYKDADFRDSHSAPRFDDTPTEEKLNSGGDFSLIEVANGFHNQPNDYFTPRIGARYYGYDDLEGMQSYTAISNIVRAIKAGINDKTITAYRAIPKELKVNKLIDGDWVAFSKEYAIGHGKSRFGEKEYKIIKQEVNPKYLWWDGNDINEWGYDTGETQSLGRSDLKKIWDEVHGEARFRILGETESERIPETNDIRFRILGDPRNSLTNVRGSWTKPKIIKELKEIKKSNGSYGKFPLLKGIASFENGKELKDHLFYHGTGSGVYGALYPSITMSEREAERSGGGGYGERYFAISVSKSKRKASIFSGMSNYISVYPVILNKEAKVIDRPDLQDSVELEDIIEEFWNNKVDAVRLGNWNDPNSEQELAVLNPLAISTWSESETNRVYGFNLSNIKEKSEEELDEIIYKAKDAIVKLDEWTKNNPRSPLPELIEYDINNDSRDIIEKAQSQNKIIMSERKKIREDYENVKKNYQRELSDNIRFRIEQERENINTEPSEAQKEAGNYKMGHVRFDGFDISIENPKGSVRSGVDKQGNEWSRVLPADYGYFRGTVGKDKDHVDVFIGDNPESDKIYVIDQIDPSTGKFDEHKVMLGFNNITKAKQTYLSAFQEGWQGLGQITRTDKQGLKEWFEKGDQKKPFADNVVRFRLPETITIDGKEKSTLNSKGLPIAQTEEGIRNFYAWFGDSKVVDESGRPLVVYHGTGTEINVFDKSKAHDKEGRAAGVGYGKGKFYLTTSEETAKSWAERSVERGQWAGKKISGDKYGSGQIPNLMELYVRIENPIKEDNFSDRLYEKTKEDQSKYLGGRIPQSIRDKAISELDKELKKEKVDGIYQEYHPQVVAFNPSQIKSATGNTGSFSSESNDIRFRIAEENPFDKLFIDLSELASTAQSKERLEELDAAQKEAKRAAKEQILKQIQGYKEGYRAGTNEMKLRLKLIQGNIISYANKNMPYSEAGKRSITSLLTAIKNASTPATIEDAFNKIDELTEKINKKTVIAQIEKILKKNRPKKVDGKSAGKLDPDIYKVLKKIREIVDLKSDEEFEKFASNLNEEDVESIALFGMFSNLENKTEDEAKEALAQLSDIVAEGKVWYKEEMKKRKEYLDGIRSKVMDKVTGGKPHMTQQDYIAAGTVPKDNFLNSYVLANQSLEWLLDIASKDKSEEAGEGWMQVHFGDLLNESTNKETKGIREAVELVNKAGERIFGVKENALARIFTANSKVVDNTGVTFATNEGRTEIPLSQNQAAKRWMEMQDPTLKGTFDKMGWDEQSLSELESFMTPQVKQWAEWQLNEFYPEYFKATNEAFRNNYFVDMPFNPKYSPIRREVIQQNNNDGELLQGSTMLNSVMSGSFISRIANINNILLQDANTVLFNHISEMEHFKAWIDSVKEMRSTLGSRDVQHAIKFEHGNKLRQEINNQINDFASGGSDKANVITLVDKIRGNFAVGELALNLSLYPKQAISILTFLADVPINKYAEGLVDMALNIKSVIDMMKSSEFIKERYLSGWNYEVRSALKKETPEILSNAKSRFNEYKNKLMFPAQFGDYTSAIGGWTVYKYNYEKQLALELLKPGITQEQAEENARKEAMTRYERSSARLLQSSALKDAASIQKGSFGKMFTMFKSQPQLQQRYESAGWRNLLRNRGSKAHNIKLIALFHVLLPVAFQAMANMFTDDDDDEKLKRLLIAGVIGSLNGFLIASDVIEFIIEKAMGSPFDYSLSPLEGSVNKIGTGATSVVKGIKNEEGDQEAANDQIFKGIDQIAYGINNIAVGLPYRPSKKIIKQVGEVVNPEGAKSADAEKLGKKILFEQYKFNHELNKVSDEDRKKMLSDTTMTGIMSDISVIKSEITQRKADIRDAKNLNNSMEEDTRQQILNEYPQIIDSLYQDVVEKYKDFDFPKSYKPKK